MDTHTDSELYTFRLLQTSIEVSHGIEDTQARAYRSMSIIFMGLRIAEIDQETITKVLGNIAIIALDDVGTHPLIPADHVPVVFGIELG
jgi:hypothetical protein